jgi:hypothetical protein
LASISAEVKRAIHLVLFILAADAAFGGIPRVFLTNRK